MTDRKSGEGSDRMIVSVSSMFNYVSECISSVLALMCGKFGQHF